MTEPQEGTEEVPTSNNLGDHNKVRELVSSQYAGLLSLMRRKLKDSELAADLVNDAIVVTLEHARLGRLRELDNMGGYVFKVSMNLLRNHQRGFSNRPDLRADATALDALAGNDSDSVEATQLKQRAIRLMESLSSERDREVVKRFYLDEHDKQTICDELELTPLQFTQVMSRARSRMRQIFDSQGLKRGDYFSLML